MDYLIYGVRRSCKKELIYVDEHLIGTHDLKILYSYCLKGGPNKITSHMFKTWKYKKKTKTKKRTQEDLGT